MSTYPTEYADAVRATREAWEEYQAIIDRPHETCEALAALDVANMSEAAAQNWYKRWQAVGGTSNIESIVQAEELRTLAVDFQPTAKTIRFMEPSTLEKEQ